MLRARTLLGAGRAHWLDLVLVGVVLAIAATFVATMLWSRLAAKAEASRELSNMVVALDQGITHNVDILDLTFRNVVAGLRDPAVMASPPDLRRRLLFDKAAAAEYVDRLFVLDAQGSVILDAASATPGPVFDGDRSYFTAHLANPGLGLYVGEPFLERNGELVVGLSRRIDKPDGSFGGVVVATLRLAYFRTLFARAVAGLLHDAGFGEPQWFFSSLFWGAAVSSLQRCPEPPIRELSGLV